MLRTEHLACRTHPPDRGDAPDETWQEPASQGATPEARVHRITLGGFVVKLEGGYVRNDLIC
jgi:hypothetical protein